MATERRFVRWVLHRSVKFRQGGAEAPCRDCVITDLSFKGAKINIPVKLPRDTFMQLSIILAEDFILNVEAWVVWYKTVDGINSYGLYFSKIHDHDKEKIYRFIYENYPKQLNEKRWGINVPPDEGKEDKQMEDRRIFQRFSVKRPVRFLDMDSGEEGQALTLDISAKGMGLTLGRELKAHSALEMWLEVSTKEEPIYTRGEVVWSRKDVAGSFAAGINLEKADLFSLSRLLR
ncbi:MAG: PilZ domain-containing protein [Candidatus Omnitrophota bacterium]|jgi:c-di-GMP-binding flagellar brake protein YcgR